MMLFYVKNTNAVGYAGLIVQTVVVSCAVIHIESALKKKFWDNENQRWYQRKWKYRDKEIS